jgi:hypothetical protein
MFGFGGIPFLNQRTISGKKIAACYKDTEGQLSRRAYRKIACISGVKAKPRCHAFYTPFFIKM